MPNSGSPPPSHHVHSGAAAGAGSRVPEEPLSRHLLPRGAGANHQAERSSDPGEIQSFVLKFYEAYAFIDETENKIVSMIDEEEERERKRS